MQPQEIEIHDGESVTIGDISLSLVARGHRITEHGDMSIADLTLAIPGKDALVMRLSSPAEDITATLGEYRVRLVELGWNGKTASLSIEKVS